MTKKEKVEVCDSETPDSETTKRMHSIILKEKDKEGNWLSIDVDMVMPTFILGETQPMLMGVVDDRAYFIPIEQVNWFEQNFGVKNDSKLAEEMAEIARQKRTKTKKDVAFN